MASLLDLIRASTAPAAVMRNAALGKLNIPAAEQLEVLVHLANHAELGTEARATLASWSEQELATVCAEAQLPEKVAEFFLYAGTRQLPVVTALVGNPALAESLLVKFAADAPAEYFPCLFAAARSRRSRATLFALSHNRSVATRLEEVESALRELEQDFGPSEAATVLAAASSQFELEYAEEITSEPQRPFELTLGMPDEKDELAELFPLVKENPHGALDVKHIEPEQRQQLSTLQKIAALNVPERVQLAQRGSREERMILIRDGVKVVALAVLESPKLSETEMESFAGMRNVQEAVLRGIAMRRRYLKLYGVVRALVHNPKTPLDVSLPLLKTLLTMDLKTLIRNKGVPELVTRIATKIYLEKSTRER
jgi:hypothetical protein